MRFIEPRPYADPDVAARKIVELANAAEAVQDGRIHIEKRNGPMLFELKATPKPASQEERRRVIEDYANGLREIIEKLRRRFN